MMGVVGQRGHARVIVHDVTVCKDESFASEYARHVWDDQPAFRI